MTTNMAEEEQQPMTPVQEVEENGVESAAQGTDHTESEAVPAVQPSPKGSREGSAKSVPNQGEGEGTVEAIEATPGEQTDEGQKEEKAVSAESSREQITQEENLTDKENEKTADEDGGAKADEAGDEAKPDETSGEEVQDATKAEAAGEELQDATQAETGEQEGGEGEQLEEQREKEESSEGEEQLEREATMDESLDREVTQSDLQGQEFAEPESGSPITIGEKLSRETTPSRELQRLEEEDGVPSPPVPGTPGRDSYMEDEREEEEEEEEEDEEEEEEDIPQYNREELIDKYHQAKAERHRLEELNHVHQHKLAEYFRKKKADDARQEIDKNVADQEQRYLKYMANLDEYRKQYAEEREQYKEEKEEQRQRCEQKQDLVNEEIESFMHYKKQIAISAINSRSGKTVPLKDIEQQLALENRKEAEVTNVRLENIKLKNKLKKKESQLKSKEELAEGLHLIDFEQLKIENQTYNEKIEERNEELLKLRKKITSTVQVLTHLKEKLQFVQKENQGLKEDLRKVEDTAAKKRDILSRTKQARDALRIDNQKLRQNCGLLGNEPLLRDFEEKKDESDDLLENLEKLKMRHAELTLNLHGVKRKIEQARVGR